MHGYRLLIYHAVLNDGHIPYKGTFCNKGQHRARKYHSSDSLDKQFCFMSSENLIFVIIFSYFYHTNYVGLVKIS